MIPNLTVVYYFSNGLVQPSTSFISSMILKVWGGKYHHFHSFLAIQALIIFRQCAACAGDPQLRTSFGSACCRSKWVARMTASAILSDIQMSSRLVLSTTYPQGFKAVRPAICPESRLSRELGAPLYSVQLGTRKTKPQLLYPLVLSELQRAAPRLQAVCGRAR